jgi:hypothetical protein
MDNQPPKIDPSDESAQLRKEVERLSAENLLLRQRAELGQLWYEDREKQSEAFRQHKKDVEGEINKRLVGLSLVGLLVVGLGWWSVSLPMRQSVQERLDKEFASDNIKTLISDAALRAAQLQSGEMMDKTLKPAVNEAMTQIQQQRRGVTEFTNRFRLESGRSMDQIRNEIYEDRRRQSQSLNTLRDQYTEQIGELRLLVKFQEDLKGIELLKNSAIDGDVDAYNRLIHYKTQEKDLAAAARTAIIEAKEPYLGIRTGRVSIWLSNPDGTQGPKDEHLPSAALVSLFLLDAAQQWEYRVKAAELLASKREAGVAEARLKAMQDDKNLWVRRAALRSFEELTGFREADVFDFDEAAEWWEKNKSSYLRTISK